MMTWEYKFHHSEHPPVLFPPALGVEHGAISDGMGWDIPGVSWGQPSQLCPLPISHALQSPHWRDEEQKSS